jgi:RNA polymerase sigma-70 factor (ECF subfamily)
MTAGQESDAELVRRVRAGERDALGVLYDRHAATALAVALRIVGDRAEAEDIVHDTFVVVWRSIESFDPARGTFASWLVTLVRNRAIDRVRGRRAVPGGLPTELPAMVVDDPNPTWQATVERLTAAEVRDALDRLPAEQRQAIELAYFDGYTYRDVARLTGVSPGTASSRLRLGLAKLREALAPSRLAAVADRARDSEGHRR